MAALARNAADNAGFVHVVLDLAEVPGSLEGIDEWIRQRYRRRDENEEVVREPAAMLEDWIRMGYFEGDCDDVATLTAAILRVFDYPARFVAIRVDVRESEFKHVFVESNNTIFDATVAKGTVYMEAERMVEHVL